MTVAAARTVPYWGAGLMWIKDPSPIVAAPASGHGCCGGDTATEPQSKIAKAGDPNALGHVKSSKAGEKCCCDGAGKL